MSLLVPRAMHFTLFSGSGNPALASAIASALGVQLGPCHTRRFPDGELHIRIEETVRGHDVFIVQPTSPPANEHLVELLVFADALRRASAERITAVMPYFGYARADKRHGGRESITARLVADLMQTAGIGRVITLDLHTPQIEGFFRIPVDSLTATPLLADAALEMLGRDAVVVAPDAGRVKMATSYASRIDLPLVVLHKRRDDATHTAVTHIVGDVQGKRCLIIDDIISTGGTIVAAANALRDAGASEEIVVAATHGLLLDGALGRLRAAGVRSVLTTDSVSHDPDDTGTLNVVSTASLFAKAVTHALGEGANGQR